MSNLNLCDESIDTAYLRERIRQFQEETDANPEKIRDLLEKVAVIENIEELKARLNTSVDRITEVLEKMQDDSEKQATLATWVVWAFVGSVLLASAYFFGVIYTILVCALLGVLQACRTSFGGKAQPFDAGHQVDSL